jgi:CDP-glucose 4,6-dehydratase
VAVTPEFWPGKRVFLTGQTGFKGGWLALWLTELGAEVHGFGLEPLTTSSFYSLCSLGKRLASSVIADIRDVAALESAIREAQPEIVLHLAAQSLVRYSYDSPVETYEVNVMGTVNLLEAARHVQGVKAVVNVTSDKCYDAREWIWPYRENEPMGGNDPYSSSKACAELVTHAYRRSFLAPAGIHLASARAGNVIGGGDWAADRLLPDFLRALDAGEELAVRSPHATRPWQHVLEPLAGYLALAENLYLHGGAFADAWNFGPADADSRTVQWVVETLCALVPGARWRVDSQHHPQETAALRVDSSKAKIRLGWQPRWHLLAALEKTLAWHSDWKNGADMIRTSLAQITDYVASDAA